jgi:hypothetical protein
VSARLFARVALVTGLPLLLALPAGAQSPNSGLTGVALVQRAEHRLRYLGSVHEQSGIWFGGEGLASFGRVRLRVSGVTGHLSGDTSVTNPDRSVRVSEASLSLQPIGWLEFGTDVVARRVASPASTVVLRLLGGHVGVAIPLGVEGLTGAVRGVYYPATDVTGDEALSLALRGEIGVLYAPSRSGIALRLSYRFERYDYAAGTLGSARLEQVRAVVVGLGIRMAKGRATTRVSAP